MLMLCLVANSISQDSNISQLFFIKLFEQYTYIHIFSYIFIYIHKYSYIFINIHIYSYIFIYTHIYSYIFIYIHIYSYIFIYIHIYSYIFIYIQYIYIHPCALETWAVCPMGRY